MVACRSLNKIYSFIHSFAAALQAVRYFRTYPNLGIIYRARKESETVGHYSRLREVVNSVEPSENEITIVESPPSNEIDDLISYTDSAYNDDVTTRRSTMGYVFLDQGGAVAWSSKQQKDPALSSTEAELVALTHGATQAQALKVLKHEMGYGSVDPIVLLGDNTGAIAVSKDPRHASRLKHVQSRHFWVRNAIKEGVVDVKYISTKEEIADIFTKALPRPAFDKHRAALGLANPPVGLRGGVEQDA